MSDFPIDGAAEDGGIRAGREALMLVVAANSGTKLRHCARLKDRFACLR